MIMTETRKRMENDFNPSYLPESMPASEIRLVHAAEYGLSAGQINRNLAQLVNSRERWLAGSLKLDWPHCRDASQYAPFMTRQFYPTCGASHCASVQQFHAAAKKGARCGCSAQTLACRSPTFPAERSRDRGPMIIGPSAAMGRSAMRQARKVERVNLSEGTEDNEDASKKVVYCPD